METKFKHALDAIRALMVVQLGQIRIKELFDQNKVDEFLQKLRIEIVVFKRAVISLRQEIPDQQTIEKLMYYKLDELLDIMGSPHPDYARAGFYVSPTKPADPVYFWAYQELSELGEWIQQSCSHDVGKSTVLSHAAEAIARQEFHTLADVNANLRGRGVNNELVKTLMHPFSRFQSPRPTGLTHPELVSLRKLKTAILACSQLPAERVEKALYALLYELNVNTVETEAFCKAHLRQQVDIIDTEADKRDFLARCRRTLKQATVDQTLFFAVRETLRDEMLKCIEAEFEFLDDTALEHEPFTHLRLDGSGTLLILNMPNEHYAASMRVQQECGFFLGTQKDIIASTGSMVISSKNKPLGSAAHIDNFKKPGNNAVNATWNMKWKEIIWMSKNWGPEYNLPNVYEMNDRDFKKFISSLG